MWTGVGIIGGWLAALAGLSSYARRRIGPSAWRKLHRLTLLGWALAVAHTFGSGSDARTSWLLVIVVSTALPVVALAWARLDEVESAPSADPQRNLRTL